MAKHQLTCHKKKLTKGLLAIILLFSSFSWSGYIYEAPAPQPAASKTEIVAAFYPDSTKGISYQSACTLYYKKYYPTNYGQPCFSTVIINYNRLIKTKVDNYKQQLFIINTTSRFLKAKTIPQHSDEDLIRPLRG